jgi:hypothetical protein
MPFIILQPSHLMIQFKYEAMRFIPVILHSPAHGISR